MALRYRVSVTSTHYPDLESHQRSNQYRSLGHSGQSAASLVEDRLRQSEDHRPIQNQGDSGIAANNQQMPTAWKFQGSNDNTAWTDLDSRSGVTTWVSDQYYDFTITSPQPFRYYRVWITAQNGYIVGGQPISAIPEIRFWESIPETKTGTSSPISLLSMPYNLYSIRVRCRTEIGWSEWTVPIQYLHGIDVDTDVIFVADQNLFTDVAGTIPVANPDDSINSWRDTQSGILATCNTTAIPKYSTDGVRFGSSGGKERLRFALPQGLTAGFSVFVVAKFLSYGYNNTILTLDDNGTWSSTSTIALVRAYGVAYDAVFHGGSTGNDINMGQYPLNTNCLISLVYDGSNMLSAYMDGVLKQTKAIGAKTTSALAYCSFGSLAWETTEWGNFYLKEVQISQRAYNADELVSIHASLRLKYGIT